MMQKAIMATLLVAAAAAGCTNPQVKDETTAAGGASSPTQTAGQASTSTSTQTPSQAVAGTNADANSLLSKNSVYYDFDNSTIRGNYKAQVQAHGAYLAGHQGARVVIEGNCDERGSREYNVGLGQRRADSVKTMLKLVGAVDGQIETVSWGEEKPKAMGSNEPAWAENRRSDIVYKRKD